MVGAGLESGCWMVGEMVVQCLNCPKVGRMYVRGRREGIKKRQSAARIVV